MLRTKEITGGLPRVAELFEARRRQPVTLQLRYFLHRPVFHAQSRHAGELFAVVRHDGEVVG